MLSLREEKARLRTHCLKVRRGLDAKGKAAADAAMARWFLSLPEYRSAGGLLLYASMPDEPDMLPLARTAMKAGKRVAFPVCLTQSVTLAFYEVASLDALVPGHYGILEPPAEAPAAELGAFSLCVVPGVCFDREGCRIGLGKGYYDRFLAGYRGVTVGLAYSGCLVPQLPREPHDARVGVVVTERGILRPDGG